ncbi:MAG: ATP-dependent Clp protease ATP-binding subunit ClpX, partial [Candidatus Marinimicrobia bacterium]|nr:ATP-dependent Clp protease ATP-binding subunit ClpX [Candidatus Neomarinimicrobiota bacterium]
MDKSPKICHFCGRPDEETDILISGAYGDTFICDECIEAAHEIIHVSEEAEES